MTEELDKIMADWQRGGYETRVRHVSPNTVREPHEHPYDVRILVLEGELALQHAGETCTYHAGEGFDLPAGTQHFEHYGPEGATLLSGHRQVHR